MGKYFIIQFKRIGRIIPVVLLIMGLFLGGIYLVYQSLNSQWSNPAKFEKISVAMVGTTNERLLDLGFQALQSMDSSNVSVEFLAMEEPDAKAALERGEIGAYLVFPDGFMDNAMGGTILPLRFVSAAGSENIISLIKDELTSALANMILTAEQGAFALGDVLAENGRDDLSYDKTNEIAMEYALRIMERAQVYTVEELGISNGLSFQEYLISGLCVVFISFMTLPFVAVLVKDEYSLQQLLKSKKVGSVCQVLCEVAAYMLWLTVTIGVPVLILTQGAISAFMYVLPAVFCLCAISYLIYHLTSDLLSGVLLQLTVAVAMCFVSGCMYPTYFFPVSVQKISRFLPAAMARDHIAGLISGSKTTTQILPLILIGMAAVLFSVLLRQFRLGGRKGIRL